MHTRSACALFRRATAPHTQWGAGRGLRGALALRRAFSTEGGVFDLRLQSSDESVLHKAKVKVVLLENIHPTAVRIFEDEHFVVETRSKALSGQELIDVAADCHILGIRSKTTLTKEFFDTIGSHNHRLWAVGCFCIGTNQVDLEQAARKGVTVFNAPFSNTRSVAEKTMAEVVALQRKLFEASSDLHGGVWKKSATGSHEVRGKTLGIVGYGRIGSQLSSLAEAFGMKVLYYDAKRTLSLSNAETLESLEELLAVSDVVTLHVPDTEATTGMFDKDMLALMKPGSQLINNARGNLVDLDALADALKAGRLTGAAIDVFPVEPESNTKEGDAAFETPLRGLRNVILTPHIGGSTEEAQEKIAEEVAQKLVSLLRFGTTSMSVNLPELEVSKPKPKHHRLLHFHENVPGVLGSIFSVISELNVNVVAQHLKTDENHGYAILDVEREDAYEMKQALRKLPHTVWCRSLLRSSGSFDFDNEIRKHPTTWQ